MSLWQPVHLAEVELIARELLADETTRLHESYSVAPVPVNDEVQEAAAQTLADYRARYGL